MFFYPKAESTVPKPFLKDVSVIQGDPPVAYKLHRAEYHDQQQGLSWNGAVGQPKMPAAVDAREIPRPRLLDHQSQVVSLVAILDSEM